MVDDVLRLRPAYRDEENGDANYLTGSSYSTVGVSYSTVGVSRARYNLINGQRAVLAFPEETSAETPISGCRSRRLNHDQSFDGQRDLLCE